MGNYSPKDYMSNEPPKWLRGGEADQSIIDEPFSVKNSDAKHRNWNKPMREIVPHFAHLYPEGLTQSEYEFDGLLQKVTQQEAQIVDLKVSNKWLWTIVLFNAVMGIVFGSRDFFGW